MCTARNQITFCVLDARFPRRSLIRAIAALEAGEGDTLPRARVCAYCSEAIGRLEASLFNPPRLPEGYSPVMESALREIATFLKQERCPCGADERATALALLRHDPVISGVLSRKPFFAQLELLIIELRNRLYAFHGTFELDAVLKKERERLADQLISAASE